MFSSPIIDAYRNLLLAQLPMSPPCFDRSLVLEYRLTPYVTRGLKLPGFEPSPAAGMPLAVFDTSTSLPARRQRYKGLPR